MSFLNNEAIIAFEPALVQNLTQFSRQYGAAALDFRTRRHTLMAYWDDTQRTIKRAAHFQFSCVPIPLSDGRFAAIGLWASAAIAAVQRGDVSGAEVLTPMQLRNLRIPD